MEVPQKSKTRTITWSSNFTPGYIFKEDKSINSKRYMLPNVHSSIIYNSEDTKHSKYQSTYKWIKNIQCVYGEKQTHTQLCIIPGTLTYSWGRLANSELFVSYPFWESSTLNFISSAVFFSLVKNQHANLGKFTWILWEHTNCNCLD